MADKVFGSASSDFARDAYLNAAVGLDSNSDSMRLGPYNTAGFLGDPKRFGFLISRHKFVAKMLVDHLALRCMHIQMILQQLV